MENELFSQLFNSAWGIVLVVFFLGGSIFIHELGHFLAAKKRGLKIDRFSIGFGPKLFTWKRNDIEYCISLLPLGGYVALPQLADMAMIEGESEDKSSLPPISCADKIIVAVMGPVFNIILALIICTILWIVGLPTTQQAETLKISHVAKEIINENGETVTGPAYEAGLKPGDLITHIDGIQVNDIREYMSFLAASAGKDEAGNRTTQLTIERDGTPMNITVRPVMVEANAAAKESFRNIGIALAYPLYVDAVFEDSPADKAGLKPDDLITHINAEKAYSIRTISNYLSENPESPVTLTVQRADQTLKLDITPTSVPIKKPEAVIEFTDGSKLQAVAVFKDKTQAKPENPQSQGMIMAIVTPKNEIQGLSFGDIISEANAQPVKSVSDLLEASEPGQPLALKFFKNAEMTPEGFGEAHSLTLPEVSDDYMLPTETAVRIGFSTMGARQIITHKDPLTQIGGNLKMTWAVLSGLLHPKSDIGINNLSGPVTISRAIYTLSSISFRQVLWFVAFININLALLNLMPLPVLDGGHIVLATIAKLRGKQLPSQIIASIQGAFMVLLLGLMFYVMFYDSLRWWGDHTEEARQNERYMREVMRKIDIDYGK